MAGLKGRIKRAQREAQGKGMVLELKDGTRRVFSDMECWQEMFLTQMELFRGESKPSEVLDAVRAATPESRARFEDQYGEITMRARVIESNVEGAWV